MGYTRTCEANRKRNGLTVNPKVFYERPTGEIFRGAGCGPSETGQGRAAEADAKEIEKE